MCSVGFIKFYFRLYRHLGIFGQSPFLKDHVIASQRVNFNMFLIIIDLESPEKCTAVVFSRLSEKLRTSLQM